MEREGKKEDGRGGVVHLRSTLASVRARVHALVIVVVSLPAAQYNTMTCSVLGRSLRCGWSEINAHDKLYQKLRTLRFGPGPHFDYT